MVHFIELTQNADTLDGRFNRKVLVNVNKIKFFYEKHIVFEKGSIEVFESYDEIQSLINKC